MRKIVFLIAMALVLLTPAAASAQTYVRPPGQTPSGPGQDSGGGGGSGDVKVLGRQYERDDMGFALTGSDMAGLAVVGVMLLGSGYALVRMRRTGRTPQTA